MSIRSFSTSIVLSVVTIVHFFWVNNARGNTKPAPKHTPEKRRVRFLLGSESYPGDLFADGKQLFLHSSMFSFGQITRFSFMMEILSTHPCFGIIAHSQPYLRFKALFQAVRGARTSHFCRYPAGVNSIGIYILSAPCYSHGQDYVMQLGISIGHIFIV